MANNKRFAVQIQFFDCDHFILRTIENCGPFVERIYVTYSAEPWSAYNKSARDTYKNPSDPEILKQSPYYHKIELVTGVWDRDEEQRNASLELAKKAGFDYLIVQDADEFYNPAELEKNINGILANPDYDYYRCRWYLFWKSTKYMLVSMSPYSLGNEQYTKPYEHMDYDFNSNFAVNLKKNVRFNNWRMVNSTNYLMLDGICFHLSYVLSDEQVQRKLYTWGHSSQVNKEEWLKMKWFGWTPNSKNLHPISRITWPKAKPYKGELPKEIRDYNPGVQKYIQPSKYDKLIEKSQDLKAYFSFFLKDIKYLIRTRIIKKK